MKKKLIKGLNYAAWLGMAFFFLTSVYFANKYNDHVNMTDDTYETNDRLKTDNANLRTSLKDCKEERNRWYKRTVACQGW